MSTDYYELGKEVREQGWSEREASKILDIFDDATAVNSETYGPPITHENVEAFWDGFYTGTKIQCGG